MSIDSLPLDLFSVISGASRDVGPGPAPAATMHEADAAKRTISDGEDDGDDDDDGGDDDEMLLEDPKDRVERRVIAAALGLMTALVDGEDDDDRVECRVIAAAALGPVTPLLLFATMATPRVIWRGSDIVLG